MIDAAQEHVKALLRAFMDSWISKRYEQLRRIEEEGFSPDGVLAPFHDALIPGIRGLGERGFSTALGNLHERIALAIGEHAHAEVRRAFDLVGPLPVLAREFITQRINQLARGEAEPDHAYEREQLLHAFGDEVPAATRVDLYIRTHEGQDHYFEIKSPKPNRGQCIEMKQRQLMALGIRRDQQAFAWWGVPYDPYGRVDEYAHPYPLRFFDFGREVKLGAAFWNFVGDAGETYDILLAHYRQIGEEYAPVLEELRAVIAATASGG
jgi:Type II restriction endonuclease, TdeIII